MSVFRHIGRVRAARRRVVLHRTELAVSTAALLARGYRYPLTLLGAAAGAGFLLGRLDVHPMRLPGLGPLLRGGMTRAMAQVARWMAQVIAEAGAQPSEEPSEPSAGSDRDA